MNEVQQRVSHLQEKGWTLAALAHELGLTVNAVEKWKAGQRYPANAKPVLAMLGQLATRRRIPKRRRYPLMTPLASETGPSRLRRAAAFGSHVGHSGNSS